MGWLFSWKSSKEEDHTLFVVVRMGSSPHQPAIDSTTLYGSLAYLSPALQMRGQWESNINVWFPFMDSQKWNCYFQIRIIMFCLPVPTLIYLWEIYIFPGSVSLFCCRKICGPILGIYKSLTDTWMWKKGLRSSNSWKRNTYIGFA
jgi:hypothetical protein